nr:hypothetical protein [Tanacetum cinerariifolium]
LREKLLRITRLISNIESLNDNSTPDRVFNSFTSDDSLLDNFSPEFEIFCDNTEETRSGEEVPVVMNDKDEDVYSSFIFVIYPEMFSLLLSAKREEVPVVMNDKDEDVYSSFIFVIYPEMFSLLLSAESEDTTFDPRISG